MSVRETKLKSLRDDYILSGIIDKFVLELVVNLSKDEILPFSGETFSTNSYSKIIENFSKSFIIDEDKMECKDFFDKDRLGELLLQNRDGKVRDTKEFRGMVNDEKKWFKAVVNCFENEKKHEAYVYVEDITEHKVWQLDAMFKADHDALTELKNKMATQTAVDTYLETLGKDGTHALFMFDIDDFKNVNSMFGHLFGDLCLAQTAKAVKGLFRSDDILGRIGGDEFVVFMKNIPHKQAALRKAEEMIRVIQKIPGIQGSSCSTSISVGISFHCRDGKSYRDMLREADVALFECKNSGKNKYAVYSDDLDQTSLPRTGTDSKTFRLLEHNASEYIFRLMRDSADNAQSFETVMELMSRYFDISHAAIYELPAEEFTFSYKSKETGNMSEKLMRDLCKMENYQSSFVDGMFFYPSNETNDKTTIAKRFSKAHCKSTIHYKLLNKDELMGYLCLTRGDDKHNFTRKDALLLRNIANFVTMFLYIYRNKS